MIKSIQIKNAFARTWLNWSDLKRWIDHGCVRWTIGFHHIWNKCCLRHVQLTNLAVYAINLNGFHVKWVGLLSQNWAPLPCKIKQASTVLTTMRLIWDRFFIYLSVILILAEFIHYSSVQCLIQCIVNLSQPILVTPWPIHEDDCLIHTTWVYGRMI